MPWTFLFCEGQKIILQTKKHPDMLSGCFLFSIVSTLCRRSIRLSPKKKGKKDS